MHARQLALVHLPQQVMQLVDGFLGPKPARRTLETQLRAVSVRSTRRTQAAFMPMLSGELSPGRSPIVTTTTSRTLKPSAASSANATRPSRTMVTGANILRSA